MRLRPFFLFFYKCDWDHACWPIQKMTSLFCFFVSSFLSNFCTALNSKFSNMPMYKINDLGEMSATLYKKSRKKLPSISCPCCSAHSEPYVHWYSRALGATAHQMVFRMCFVVLVTLKLILHFWFRTFLSVFRWLVDLIVEVQREYPVHQVFTKYCFHKLCFTD